jgi:CLIP-associating protein 1/2
VNFTHRHQISDPDALITVLRACVRHQNQLLSTATLAALPLLFPLLVQRPSPLGRSVATAAPSPTTSSSSAGAAGLDLAMLRQLLTGFLAPGGIMERLGDSREKAREHARQALVVLGGFAFRSSASGSALNKSRDSRNSETPLAIFERYLREAGLASKVARVREQVGCDTSLRASESSYICR